MNFFSQHKFFFYSLNLILISLYFSPTSFMGIFIHNDLYLYSQINTEFKVSVNHIYAFIIFSVVGYLTYVKLKHFIFLSIYLVSISVILELTHLLIPYRGFEFADLFGNIIGVTIGFIIIFFIRKYKINYII